ncbi:MAG: hypothetical protein RLZZ66_439 [Pseudomonadota bacterium]|jgi:hypothetical protein
MTDQNEQIHEKVAKRAEDIAMTATVVSAIVGIGATYAEPSGFYAIGVALGLASEPFIVTAAPIIAGCATVTGVISSSAYFYSKWKNHKQRSESAL